MKLICNENLELRSFHINMSEELFALVDTNRIHLETWLTWVVYNQYPQDNIPFLQEAQDFVQKNNAFRGGIYWNGDLVGTIGFHSYSPADRIASIGYWISKDMTGKGIVTKSVQRMLQHGFDDLMLHRIELRAATTNEKSWNIAERTGFTREGCIRECSVVNGKILSHYVYGILRTEFLNS